LVHRLVATALVLTLLAAPAVGGPKPPARDPALNPWPKPGVTVGFAQDMSLLRSDRPNSMVIVGVEDPYVHEDNRARLLVFVANRTGRDAIVTTGSVTAADDTGKPLEVLSVQRMTPAGWPPVSRKVEFSQAARELIAIDAADFMATTPNGRLAPPPSTGMPTPRTKALGTIASGARDQQTSASDLAAYAGLDPQTVPAGMMYATGASVQLRPDTKAFDMRIWVGGEDHWFTFQLQR
jgi:hypothetical protein